MIEASGAVPVARRRLSKGKASMSQKTRNRGNGEGSVFKRQDGGPWYISWYDHGGKRREHCTKTTDKTTAQRILADKLADVALRRDGVIDSRQEALVVQSKRAIEEHLAEFQAMMEARQRTEKHVRMTIAFCRKICTAAGFAAPNEITADGLNKFLADMKANGKAPRTLQGRVVAIKSFTKWLTDHGKLPHDPLRSVKAPSVKADRRLRRRMLSPTEWPYLRSATLTNGTHHGMPPFERVALYGTAIQTAFRQNELRSLTKADLFLAGDSPFIRCKADNTKNGQEARQYIEAAVVEELRQLVANKTPGAPVFAMPSEWDVAEMLRADLAEARKQWLDEVRHDTEARAKREESDFLAVKNHDGEVLDFHALRHTCGSWLALQGLHPNVIKTVMRHSTITLTMDTYGHLLPDQHAEAVGGIASMMTPKVPLAATGTAGKAPAAPAVGTAVGVLTSAKECESVRPNDETGAEHQTLEFPRKSEENQIETEERPLPDSNRGWRICNPLPYRLAKGPTTSCELSLQSAGTAFRL
jgi:integrase